jgi:hypothetical protein
LALAAYVAKGKAKGKVFGAAAGAVILLYASWHTFVSATYLDGSGVRQRGAFATEPTVPWAEITAVSAQERKRGRGGTSMFLVLERESGEEIEIGIGGLPPESSVRLIEFAKAQAAAARR